MQIYLANKSPIEAEKTQANVIKQPGKRKVNYLVMRAKGGIYNNLNKNVL